MDMSTYIPSLAVDSLFLSPTVYLSADPISQTVQVYSAQGGQSSVQAGQSTVQKGNVSFQLDVDTSIPNPAPFPSIVNVTGSYLFLITGNYDGNACAQIQVCKNLPSGTAPSMVKLVSCSGNGGEEIDLQWPADDVPQLYHSKTSVESNIVTYTVTVVGQTNSSPSYQYQ
jgi:hypothetical protein